MAAPRERQHAMFRFRPKDQAFFCTLDPSRESSTAKNRYIKFGWSLAFCRKNGDGLVPVSTTTSSFLSYFWQKKHSHNNGWKCCRLSLVGQVTEMRPASHWASPMPRGPRPSRPGSNACPDSTNSAASRGLQDAAAAGRFSSFGTGLDATRQTHSEMTGSRMCLTFAHTCSSQPGSAMTSPASPAWSLHATGRAPAVPPSGLSGAGAPSLPASAERSSRAGGSSSFAAGPRAAAPGSARARSTRRTSSCSRCDGCSSPPARSCSGPSSSHAWSSNPSSGTPRLLHSLQSSVAVSSRQSVTSRRRSSSWARPRPASAGMPQDS
mmetsp:Transcript_23577/g.67982  ORF Transcript_23577/g.67982 Transcript_23577/m.67982 type:complete len:322 (-) Transcript_23577:1768-2733(-)